MDEPILTTDRLILRRFGADDLDRYHAIFSHPEITRWLLPLSTLDEAMRNMAMIEGFWQLRGTSMMAVVRREDGLLIGRCGPWHPEILEGREIEVGWAFAPDAQGQGYATEAARAAIAWATDSFAPRRIVHLIKDDNTASQAVARRLGSRRTDETVHHTIAGEIALWAQETA